MTRAWPMAPMAIGRWLRGAVLVALLGAVVVALSCSADPTTGQLTVVIQTDFAMPKDLNYVRLEVRSDGLALGTDSPPPLYRNDYPINPADPPDLRVTIPATFAVYNNKGAIEPVAVRVTAGHDGQARVLRDAITAVPTDRNAMLRMYLQWLSDGSAVAAPAGADPRAATNACPPGQTNIAGECADAHVDVASLPDFTPALVFGAPTAAAGVGFDTLSCFAAPESVTPDAKCSFALPSGATPDQLNIGLELPPGSDGLCNSAHCIVALDRQESPVGPQVGWFLVAGRVQLPHGVCTRGAAVPAMRVVLTRACPAKSPAAPSCGPPSAATDCSIHGTQDGAAPPVGMSSGYEHLALGLNHTCTSKGTAVTCWGSNAFSQTGQPGGGVVSRSAARAVVLSAPVTAVSAGVDSTCAVSAGITYCWGNNSHGQLGTPGPMPPADAPTSTTVVAGNGELTATTVVGIAGAGVASHACGAGSGKIVCWGANAKFQIGTVSQVVNTQANGLDVSAIALGDAFTCVLEVSGVVRCWGDNASGQLGVSPSGPKEYMAGATAGAPLADGVVAGADFACALTKAKEVYCWGNTQSGAVTGVKIAGSSIRVKPPLSGPAKSLAAGLDFACAIVTGTSDTVHCWGSNGVRQLGTSDVAKTSNDPLLPFAGPYDRIVAAGERACVIKGSRMACWGSNPSGQITGTPTAPLPPTEVAY